MATTINQLVDKYKSPFIIYNRNNKLASSDLPVFNDTDDIRNCFIFDKDNRSILACTVSKSDADNTIVNFEQLSGHVLYNSKINNGDDSTLNIVGQHGERFNDYENNLPLGIYSFTAGFNTIALNQFESAFGIYNVSVKGTNQLFSIGNGRSESSRNNIFTVYDDKIIINSPLTIYGSITADNIKDVDIELSSLRATIKTQSEQITQLVLKNKELEDLNSQQAERITDCENTINQLIDSLNTLTARLSNKVLLYIDDDNNNNPSDNPYDTNTYVTDTDGNYVQYTDKKNNKTDFVVL